MLGSGKAFCLIPPSAAPTAPAQPAIATYSNPTFLCPDSNGQVYSSYLFNPRVVNAAGVMTPGIPRDPATLAPDAQAKHGPA